MLDIRFVRENPDIVKENIKKKFQDEKLPLVDEVIELDARKRVTQQEAEALKAERNKLSKANGPLYGRLKKASDEEKPAIQAQIEENNAKVKADADRLSALEQQQTADEARIREIMLTIPNIIDPSVPIGPDDSCNVEVQRFGEAKVPEFPIPYHTDIMESFDGVDMDAAGRVSGSGFYYLLGNIARLHEAVLAYARDFMISKGFTYCIPPFMIHGNVVEGVMSQTDMDAMMYKIEGEDLYLIGTSEHSMIGRYIDQIIPAEKLPQTMTSYSPCFRKEKGSHGIEERGVYRIHQFEKQEMIVVCKPEDSKEWYEKLWNYSVELFRSLDIPVRQLECCSGDLADLKVKSCDIEAWSPRQQKYFEVCSCSNLGDAQARRLKIRYKDENGKMQLCHTLNNTCVAPPRMLIAFLENNLQEDGSVVIPEVLRPYMGGLEVMVPNKK
ncbi:MAG: serine--tRNA ligase [Oscillospiraceae bacterium]|nr:serine--tRNA ligase [Oscillospiraceae bacterium]